MTTALSAWLAERGAQHDVVTWAAGFGDDWGRAWAGCPRGDWLLGIAARAGVAPALVASAALDVARFGLEDVSADALPVAGALERAAAAIATGDPAAALGLHADADAFEAAGDRADDPALAATLLSVACALRAPSSVDEAASVAVLVAQAAVFSAGDCAMTAALGYAQRRAADLVRARIPASEIVARLVG